jgi:hypothetical protein
VFKQYADALTEQENYISAIVGDRVSRIFSPNSIRTKDKFLTGVEGLEFTKQEQIDYTCKNYIK